MSEWDRVACRGEGGSDDGSVGGDVWSTAEEHVGRPSGSGSALLLLFCIGNDGGSRSPEEVWGLQQERTGVVLSVVPVPVSASGSGTIIHECPIGLKSGERGGGSSERGSVSARSSAGMTLGAGHNVSVEAPVSAPGLSPSSVEEAI
eukprot:CAMPEP_0181196090 /NCGR_PEP_ID=MMETSP1096-20121128/15259_1 /TAXON_ID=156174 ORGANISM="Chrysochromulina ericina, Strain CCMP281" /NCGR_SAMPLE_ID=MMETSP1096 /ASSEMBLY_ACC=CAM_ASM_000453 /LENGTH=146 /DNA_ID=CAMNT_0023285785 /DNA_START=1190 /DNA_END=1630 /DNA_ORIENTATION=+